jgi:ribonuclease HI/ribosomal protein S20
MQLPPGDTTIKLKNANIFDISKWVQTKNQEKELGLQVQHLTDTIERKRGISGNSKSIISTLSIQTERWDQVFIKKVIEDSTIRTELLEALEENQEILDLSFYTDGSYSFSKKWQEKRLGYGVVQVDSQGNVIRDIKGSVNKWFSSSRPELRAILEAILVSPSGSKVNIYTDSKAAIEAIHKALSTNRIRAWLKTTNSSILTAIKEGIQTKEIDLTLNKIKAHSGIVLNDRADKLAKEGAEMALTSDIMDISTKDFVFKPRWQNSYIESPIRSFIKRITNTIFKIEWTFFRGKNDTLHRGRVEDKDWKVFRSLLLKHKKAQSRTLEEDLRRSFVIKCINRALPTLEKRALQRPDLYSSTTCIKCHQENESFEHLINCPIDFDLWNEEEKRILRRIWEELPLEERRIGSLEDISNAFTPKEINLYLWRAKLARGIITLGTREKLIEIGFSQSSSKKLVVSFLEEWLKFLQKTIWKDRCSKVVEWEKSLNIKTLDKRKKRNSRRKTKSKGSVKNNEKRKVGKENENKKEKEEEWKQILSLALSEIHSWIRKGVFSIWNHN